MQLNKILKSNRQESLDEKQKEGKTFKLQGHVNVQGLNIAIENKVGSIRKGVDDDGEEWITKMFHSYGYIVGTMGVDGDPVDVYLGPLYKNPEKVFIVHQKNPETGKYDEDKCMLGFADRLHARDAYLAHYDTYEFLGTITEMPFEEFKKKVLATKNKPGVIKSIYGLLKSLNDADRKDFNEKHPRDDKGKFANKISPITNKQLDAQEGKAIKQLFEEFKSYIVGNYKTPLRINDENLQINITEQDFTKLIAIDKMGRKSFTELIENGRYDWNKVEVKDYNRYQILNIIKQLLIDPDEIIISNHPKIKSDFIFKLRKNNKIFYLGFTYKNRLTTAFPLEASRLDKISGEVVYRKKEGITKSISPQNLDLLLQWARRGQFRDGNLVISDILVKGNSNTSFINKIFKSQMNLFGGEGNRPFTQMHLFKQDDSKHVGDTVEGKHGTLIVKKNPSGKGAHFEYVNKKTENKKESSSLTDGQKLKNLMAGFGDVPPKRDLPALNDILLPGDSAEKKSDYYNKRAADEVEFEEIKPENIEGKVQKQLDDAQKNKEFKDIGERVPLSKKEIAAYRRFTVEDLEKLDNASAFTLVTKDKFIPDLDIEKLKGEGQPAGLVWYKKKLRDLVAQKPANKETARKLFVERLPIFFEKIDSATSIDEIIDHFRKEFVLRRKSYRSDAKTYSLKDVTGEYKDVALEDVFGKSFLNFAVMENDTAKNQIAQAKMMNAFSKEEAEKAYQDAVERFGIWKTKQIEEAKNMSEDKLSSELGYEYNHSPFLTSIGLTPQKIYTTKRDKPDEYKVILNKYREFRIKRVENSKLSFNNYDEFIKQRPQYAPRESDWSWTDSSNKKERQINTELKIHDNPPLEFIKRKDGREVTAKEIRPEVITQNFGFKSVQLGHYVQDKEAKEHIKHFIASMKDLEDVLGIDLKKLNEEGGLSLSFGARGHGKALAHYEPTFKIINITKSRGDGSVAHEWAHYLDHFIGGGLLPDKLNDYMATHKAINGNVSPNDELMIAVAGVNEAIRKGEGTVKKKFEPTTSKAYIPGLKSLFEKEGLEGAVNYINTKVRDSDRKFAFEILAKLKGEAIEVELPKRKSDFLEGAQSFRSDYWVRPLEMFARAAEAYVYDKLEEKGMYNNYLVSGNKSENTDAKWELASVNAAYPQGEERKRINQAFDKLFGVLKKKGFQKKYEVPEPRVDEFIDLQKSVELEFLDFIIEPEELLIEEIVI